MKSSGNGDVMLIQITEAELQAVQIALYKVHSIGVILEHIGFEETDVYKNRYSSIVGNLSELLVENTERALDIINEVL